MATATTTVTAVVSAPAAGVITANTTVTAVVNAPATTPVAGTLTATTTLTAVVSAPASGTQTATTTVQAVVSAPTAAAGAGFYRYSAATQSLIPLYVYRLSGGVLRPVGGEAPAVTPDTTAPTAPTNVTTSSVTSSGFTVSWTASTDNVGVASYDVQLGGVTYASPTGTSATITGLTASTTYSVRVRARDSSDNYSALSTAVTVTTSAATTNALTTESGSAITTESGDPITV